MKKILTILALLAVVHTGQVWGDPTVFHLRYLHWNIGHYCNGNDYKSAITAENYVEKKSAYRNIFAKYHADIAGLCEWSEIFYENENATDALLSQYAHHYIAPTQRYYIGVALHSIFPLTELKEITLARNYTAYEGVFYIGGKKVIVCECHLPWQSAALHDEAQDTLLARYKNEERVVIAGDFNFLKNDCDSSYNVWKNAGFESANRSYQGDLITCYNVVNCSSYLDNIFVKGGKIMNTMVEYTTPEGYQLINRERKCDDTERLAWEAVNLSDHFPMISDIVFEY